VKSLAGALGFFSRIPVGRNAESYDSLRKNLWILPIVGIVLGILIAIPAYVVYAISKKILFVAILFYLAVEGINHVDGLADFADSIFAPKHRKLEALKDLKTGVGGTIAVCIYVLTLMVSFTNLSGLELVVAIVNSQMMAKFGMLLLLTTTKPLWNGLASSMMEFASKRDLIVGLAVISAFSAVCVIVCPKVLWVNSALIGICVAYRGKIVKDYGGVNGDMVGALNCIVFASGLVLFSALY
jgi:adenosylcobinamide-GDP ribazoletransferase